MFSVGVSLSRSAFNPRALYRLPPKERVLFHASLPLGCVSVEEKREERQSSLEYDDLNQIFSLDKYRNLHREDMSDNEKDFVERVKESRSASRSVSPRGSGKSAQSPAPSKEGSRHSRSKSRSHSRSNSRSRSHRSSRRRYTHSRSRSRSHRRRSRSRSYSGEYRRRRSHSHSPMSNRRRHVGNRANPDPNCCLGVFGLSLYTTERDLREVFSKYGPLADVSIVYDQQSRRSRGFAFVYFEAREDAKEAKERANGMELDGRRIRVDFSITKRPHTPTPGIYMGRPTYGGGAGGGGGGPSFNRRSRDYGDRGYDRGYDRYDDREYYRSYRRRSPSPYYSRGAYRSRSRSRSYSPRHY
ncbi:hypothetical protein AAFF_G00333360 [Aldrovandia affinis]|uniref:Transformer-2 protein homolog beta n=1 Tax=Aldrovandia affinis TaxID=143900 RepID=A0AAD7R6M5_9TELE|nr:hypothetical protein AAFF_G00333360 [Aldrovandia affinis]